MCGEDGSLLGTTRDSLEQRIERAVTKGVEVIVVGAGLAGISVANRLVSKVRSLLLLELGGEIGENWLFKREDFLLQKEWRQFLKSPFFFQNHAQVIGVDGKKQLLFMEKGGKTYAFSYRHLVIASGASFPVSEIFVNVEPGRVLSLPTAKALLQEVGSLLGERILWLGSWKRGLSLLETLHHMGYEVLGVLETSPYWQGGRDSLYLLKEIPFFRCCRLLEVESGKKKGVCVSFLDSFGEHRLEADVIVVAEAPKPSIYWLLDRGLQLQFNQGYISVSSCGKTEEVCVYALGDVVSLHWEPEEVVEMAEKIALHWGEPCVFVPLEKGKGISRLCPTKLCKGVEHPVFWVFPERVVEEGFVEVEGEGKVLFRKKISWLTPWEGVKIELPKVYPYQKLRVLLWE